MTFDEEVKWPLKYPDCIKSWNTTLDDHRWHPIRLDDSIWSEMAPFRDEWLHLKSDRSFWWPRKPVRLHMTSDADDFGWSKYESPATLDGFEVLRMFLSVFLCFLPCGRVRVFVRLPCFFSVFFCVLPCGRGRVHVFVRLPCRPSFLPSYPTWLRFGWLKAGKGRNREK